MKPLARSDVVLSSGFLAFASHLGFLRGLQTCRVEPSAVVGTSSGALVGALYVAGKSLLQISELLTSTSPLGFLRLSTRPWQGVFDAPRLLALLERELPATFEELGRPFAVGVVDVHRTEHRLICSGALPRAVLASCAVPRLFRPVTLDGVKYEDGGTLDRLGIAAWRLWRPGQSAILHHVARSMGPESNAPLDDLLEVASPRSHNSLWRLHNFESEMQAARLRTEAALQQALEGS